MNWERMLLLFENVNNSFLVAVCSFVLGSDYCLFQFLVVGLIWSNQSVRQQQIDNNCTSPEDGPMRLRLNIFSI